MIPYQILLLIIAKRDKTYKKMYAMVNIAVITSFMTILLFGY